MFKKVREALGFDQCQRIISGAAPIMRETIEFFYSLDIMLMEGYGMSETSGELPMSAQSSYYGRPLSVSGRLCYILPMFLLIYFF